MIIYSKAMFLSIQKSLLKKKKYQKLRGKYPIQIWTIKNDDDIKEDDITYICNSLIDKKNT